MKIRRATASPTVLAVGDRVVLISPPSLRGYGMIFDFLATHIDPPEGEDDPEWTPALADPASSQLFSRDLGLAVLLYVVMERDHPESRIGDAIDLADQLDEAGRSIVIDKALVRPSSEPAGMDLSHWKSGSRSAGVPLNRKNFGKMLESADFHPFSPIEVASWSLDQVENRIVGGSPDVQAEGVPMTPQETAEWWKNMSNPEYREKYRKLREEQDRHEAEVRARRLKAMHGEAKR